MSEATPDDVKASVVPKSDQLNADDLLTGPITVTVAKVRKGDKEQPIIVELADGLRPYKPCKSMRRVLIAAFGDDPKAWVGQQITLYCDPEVMWAGVKVGGIRISHLSIDETRTFVLTTGRGKRSEYVIHPVEVADPAVIDQLREDIAAAETMEELKAVGFVIKQQNKGVREALRAAYAGRQDKIQRGDE